MSRLTCLLLPCHFRHHHDHLEDRVAALITTDKRALFHLGDREAVVAQDQRCSVCRVTEADLSTARLHSEVQGELGHLMGQASEDGEIVNFEPKEFIDVALYWLQWKLSSVALESLTAAAQTCEVAAPMTRSRRSVVRR
jgi:hypothetical protein